MSAYDLMSPYLKSQNLVEFFDKLCASYAYTSMKETPAIMALTMFTDNHVGGTYYVAGSAQTYSNALERAIERYGGTVLYESLVKQIEFEDDAASGVRLTDGTIIRAKRVVSGTTVWNLFHKLIPRDRVSDEQKEWADAQVATYPAMVTYAAVDKKVFPDDLNAVEYYVRDLTQIDLGDITLYIPTVDDHSLGPEDEHVITMFSPVTTGNWPRPYEPEYQTKEYEEKKKKQAELILDEVEKRIPGFRSGIRMLSIASPSTIERYTLKNWGSVGGPKQMVGQEITKRLPARTPWSGVYACGDSTTMGMGMPAATASGFGAANVILRAMKKKEFHRRSFENDYVTYVQSNPKPVIPDEIDGKTENASLIARKCQHCENHACKHSCPAGIDIAGFVRRIEARNFAGAARLIRESNPFAEVCGHVCSSPCENVCNRLSFDSEPVQIRELHRWIAEFTREESYSQDIIEPLGKSVCVVGAGPAGLSCAYYLARLGYSVWLFDSGETPGGYLHELVEQGKIPHEVLVNEISRIMLSSISFRGGWAYTDDKLEDLKENNAAVFLTVESDKTHPEGGYVLTGGRSYSESKDSYEVVHAVADGRKAAMSIHLMIEKI
jgi:prolycopene isomerase